MKNTASLALHFPNRVMHLQLESTEMRVFAYCRARNGPVEKTNCKHSPKRMQKPTPQRPSKKLCYVETPWGPMRTYGGATGPVGAHGDPWGATGCHGDPWGPMGISPHSDIYNHIHTIRSPKGIRVRGGCINTNKQQQPSVHKQNPLDIAPTHKPSPARH